MNAARLPLLAVVLGILFVAPASAMEKWLYCPTNLLVDKNVDGLESLWKRASASGYTHVLLADSKFSRLEEMDPRYFKNVERVKRIAAELHLEIVPAVFPIGYSNDFLHHDPNLIEALPVKVQPMIVEGGIARVEVGAAPSIPGGDFSDLKKWSWKDETVVYDHGTARVTDVKDNARIVQKVKVQPWRQYHVSVRVKTQDFHGEAKINVLPASGHALFWDALGNKSTQDWTVHHAVFNSQENTELSIFFGIWGGAKGSLWWDDATIEETAFVNLARRPGCPLVVANADDKPLAEGVDFEPLKDPRLGITPWPGEYDTWHEPPALRTRLPDGTRLHVSYYHGATVNDHQAMICPSEPRTIELLREQAGLMVKTWSAKGYMMSHDEIRVLNWCAACESRHLTPGQILADNVKTCVQILREANPGGRIYVWSDMFDPNHNAVKGPYYLVNGPLTGSWEGLDKDVIVVPWYYSKREASLRFFAERGHRQVIAGYYDAAPEKAADWLAAASKVPGSVIGIMYTTWRHDYSQIEKFARVVDDAAK